MNIGTTDMRILRVIACSPQAVRSTQVINLAKSGGPRFYSAVNKLQKQGWVEAKDQESDAPLPARGTPRKLYSITTKGTDALNEYLLQSPSEPLECQKYTLYNLQLASEVALLATALRAYVTADPFTARFSLEGNHDFDAQVTGLTIDPASYHLMGKVAGKAHAFSIQVKASTPFAERPESDIVIGTVRFKDDLTI